MNYTTRHHLPQWSENDRIQMADFNQAMSRIESELNTLGDGKLQAAVGCYTGTGTYGAEHPTRITLSFSPKMVVITAGAGAGDTTLQLGCVFISGQTSSRGMGNLSSTGGQSSLTVSWPVNGVSWYSTSSSNTDSAKQQYNQSGVTYHYFAIG